MSVRDELKRLNRDDLDAFILEEFRHVSRNLSPLMSNQNKINSLLQEEENEGVILDAFYRWSATRPGVNRDRLLLLLPAPRGSVPSEAAAEAGAIRDALLRSSRGRAIDVFERSFVTVDGLRDTVAQIRPHAIHIATHGGEGALEIMDGRGHAVMLKVEALAELLCQGNEGVRSGSTPLRLLTLSACMLGQYTSSFVPLIDCTIGMKDLITPDAVIIFASTFYKALGDGDSVAIAFHKARTSTSIHNAQFGDYPTLDERIHRIAEATYFPLTRK